MVAAAGFRRARQSTGAADASQSAGVCEQTWRRRGAHLRKAHVYAVCGNFVSQQNAPRACPKQSSKPCIARAFAGVPNAVRTCLASGCPKGSDIARRCRGACRSLPSAFATRVHCESFAGSQRFRSTRSCCFDANRCVGASLSRVVGDIDASGQRARRHRTWNIARDTRRIRCFSCDDDGDSLGDTRAARALERASAGFASLAGEPLFMRVSSQRDDRCTGLSTPWHRASGRALRSVRAAWRSCWRACIRVGGGVCSRRR